jgi:ATP-dependent helicase/nuclease subunit A
MLRHEADAVDKEKIRTFLSGDLAARVIASPAVYREKCFTCGVKAGEVYPDLHGEEAQETVIVDGVADLAFVEDGALVIVDYKTDGRVTDEILRGRYSGQLNIYARCLAELLDIDVKETLIYSFSLGKTVEITQ